MAVTRYARRSPFLSPWRELEDMSDRLNLFFGTPVNGGSEAKGGWSPSVNVEETKDGLTLTAELPGMSIDDLEIEVENNVLSLRGEKKEEREEGDDRRFHVWERRYGSFERKFSLPQRHAIVHTQIRSCGRPLHIGRMVSHAFPRKAFLWLADRETGELHRRLIGMHVI